MTISLAEEKGKTRLTWRMRFDDPAEFARVNDFIAKANEENMDRQQAYLSL